MRQTDDSLTRASLLKILDVLDRSHTHSQVDKDNLDEARRYAERIDQPRGQAAAQEEGESNDAE